MEDILIKFLPGMGSGGIVGIVLLMVAKRYFEDAKAERALLEAARAETVAQMDSRIGALEESVRACEQDRTKLWERLVDEKRKAVKS